MEGIDESLVEVKGSFMEPIMPKYWGKKGEFLKSREYTISEARKAAEEGLIGPMGMYLDLHEDEFPEALTTDQKTERDEIMDIGYTQAAL